MRIKRIIQCRPDTLLAKSWMPLPLDKVCSCTFLSHILISPVPPGQISQNSLNFLKNLQDPVCNDRQWYHFLSLFLPFLTLLLRFKLHGNFHLYYVCFPHLDARTCLPCCRKRVDRFHRITHRHLDPSRPSAPPIAPQRPHSPHLQRRPFPLFLSPLFLLTPPPRSVSATIRAPINKPCLPPFQEWAERASLPVVGLTYLPIHSHTYSSSRPYVRRPFVLISPLNSS